LTLKPARLQWSDDGSLRSLDFGDVYFQHRRGPEEKYYVFLEQNRLPERFAAPVENSFRIAELGFGSGLNFLLTAELWAKTAPRHARLTYVSIEKHPIQKTDLERIYAFWPQLASYAAPLLEQYPPLLEGFHHLRFPGGVSLMLVFGDAAEALTELTGSFNAWYLDGFSPAKNPEMWAEKLFPRIAALTAPGGTLASFSSVGDFRRSLKANGFEVKKVQGFGIKYHMTTATLTAPRPPRPPQKKNVAVLGAGIAGAGVAYALAQKGHDVTVIDRQPFAAAETSGNPVGIVYPKLTLGPSPLGSLHQHGFGFTRGLVKALHLPSWNPCGVVHLDIDAESRERRRLLYAQGYPDDYLKYETTGLYQPTAGSLSPPEFCRALLDHPKITQRYSTTINTLQDIDSDAIVIALNHGSKNFIETKWLPLQGLRGQITTLAATPQSRKIDRVFCHDGYITPAVGGIHYVGATFQREEPGLLQLRDEDHRENLLKLDRHMPGLGFSEAAIRGGRAGYRTTTPDKLPMIGACPDYQSYLASFRPGQEIRGADLPGLYLSTAFGAFGVSGAPLAGEIIASQISGDPLPVPVSLMRFLEPARFILRDLKRGKL
jgi:tRNA 5-methylaminomethyl-2-thiouridine biosynthesis bifunctional protein